MITLDTVKYVAELSRLKVDAAFAQQMCSELGDILKYMDTINSTVDTDTVDDICKSEKAYLRNDKIMKSLDRDVLLANAPERTDETPIVPKTVE